MTKLNINRSKSVLFSVILCFSITCIFSNMLIGSDAKEIGQLETYEQKSLFIFPLLYADNIGPGILNNERKQFMAKLLYRMFVKDFKRIDFYDVRAGGSIDAFLNDAQSYIRQNSKQITALRIDTDKKFKEAMVTGASLQKTVENSFAMVPVIDSLQFEINNKDDSQIYNFYLYIHFDIYNTKTKKKLKTLQINNKKNILGSLSSINGSMQVDNSDLAGLSKKAKAEEKSFRSSAAGLYAVLKKELKKMPEFCIMGTLSKASFSKFGFDMGHDTGIKIDHRYKTFVSKANGKKKMTGFGKIRKIKGTYSEAQTLIGRPQEGDQVMEVQKLGINIIGGYATLPLQISTQDSDIVSGPNPCFLVGLEYELGPTLKLSELYTVVNLRFAAPTTEPGFTSATATQMLLNVGLLKKIYFRRFALNLGGYAGYNTASIKDNSSKFTGASLGFTINSTLEIMLSPSFSIYGGVMYDVYPKPSTYKEDDVEYDLPSSWEWKAQGLSLSFGAKVTF